MLINEGYLSVWNVKYYSDNVSWQRIFVLSDANSTAIIAIHYKEDILMKQFIQETAGTVLVSFIFVQLVN